MVGREIGESYNCFQDVLPGDRRPGAPARPTSTRAWRRSGSTARSRRTTRDSSPGTATDRRVHALRRRLRRRRGGVVGREHRRPRSARRRRPPARSTPPSPRAATTSTSRTSRSRSSTASSRVRSTRRLAPPSRARGSRATRPAPTRRRSAPVFSELTGAGGAYAVAGRSRGRLLRRLRAQVRVQPVLRGGLRPVRRERRRLLHRLRSVGPRVGLRDRDGHGASARGDGEDLPFRQHGALRRGDVRHARWAATTR